MTDTDRTIHQFLGYTGLTLDEIAPLVEKPLVPSCCGSPGKRIRYLYVVRKSKDLAKTVLIRHIPVRSADRPLHVAGLSCLLDLWHADAATSSC
jgi:hypothetical protein